MRNSLNLKAVITPESYKEKIIIVSTVKDHKHCQTAIAHVKALNSSDALNKVKANQFRVCENHESVVDALSYHNTVVFDLLNL